MNYKDKNIKISIVMDKEVEDLLREAHKCGCFGGYDSDMCEENSMTAACVICKTLKKEW